MKKKSFIWIAALIASIVAVYLLITILGKGKPQSDISEFSPYISGYTSGTISKTASIKIQLSANFAKTLGPVDERPENLFSFNPDIDGKTGWMDYRTIQFIPDQSLMSDKEYNVKFKLVKLDSDVDRNLREFIYNIKTKPQNFSAEIKEFKTIDKKDFIWNIVRGIIKTSDVADNENVNKMITASVQGNKKEVRCRKIGPRKFEFIVDSLDRTKFDFKLDIDFNGEPLNLDKNTSEYIIIPEIDKFIVMNMEVVQASEQYVKIQLSDPVSESQYLDGLITISGNSELNFSVQDNLIKVYPENRIDGVHKVTVNTGIKNIHGKTLKESYSENLNFEKIMPAVKMTGNGVIMPKSKEKLVMPFEAVNLKAVDVRISKIFENNVMQFLQVNDMDDNYQMKRVAKAIKTKTVFLDQTNVTDLSKWKRYTLDLNQLIKTDPGAIYRVDISFRKKYSLYPCNSENNDKDQLEKTIKNDDEKFWDNYENYYYNSGYRNWENRNNPCKTAYYGFRRAASRNIFASEMGMIAKKGNNGSLMLIINDLSTTEPLKDVQVNLYNYQQQKITSQTTNFDGIAEFEIDPDNEPYFAIANYKKDKSYLKLNDGNTLSVSDFDVKGVDVSKGIKAFMFTERGVRRPGDSVYVGLIVNDLMNKLPEGHPVVFEFTNPKSQQVDKQIQHLNSNHFHVFRSKTSSGDITGNYTAKIEIGGNIFYKTIPVETIKPNRLKIDFNIQDNAFYAGKTNPVNIWINWLHGTPGKNLETKVSMSLYPSKTSFESFDSFHFDDVSSSVDYQTNEIIKEETDNEGHILKQFKAEKIENAPGKLIAKLTIKAFEKGGNFSIKEKQYPYYPYESFVGMELPESGRAHGNYLATNKNHRVKIVNVNNKGGLINKSGKLKVELLKSDWSWWYHSYKNSSNYTNSEHIDLIDRDIVYSKNGKASWDFEIKDNNWGYYILRITDINSGHATSQRIYADWPRYSGVGRSKAKSANILRFRTEKDTYQVNEEIKVKLPGADNGRAFISIENGSEVIDHYWLETESGETEFSFTANEKMTPNVYIHITLLQPHEQTSNDRPIRMYGVIPVNVENKETHLQPVINMNDELESESEINIEVSESDKKDMTYTLAIVDEGLLSLTNFNTPQPWKHFYAREALGVKTWDIYDWVIGAYGTKIERLLSIGGGDKINKESSRKSNRFTPVVKFLGPFDLKGGKTQNHKVKLPRYVGAVRTMVVAGNNKGAYGNAEKTSKVTKPLMVLGSMPRVLSPGEKINLPVSVFAMEESINNVKIKIKTNDLLEMEGSAEKNISFSKTGEKTISFPVKVSEKTGKAKVEIFAYSGMEKSKYEIELDVKNPNPSVTVSKGFSIKEGKSYDIVFDKFGIQESSSATLELYSIPPLNLTKRLKYLMNYPHGCLEQIVSSAFPQLYLDKFIKLTHEKKKLSTNNVKKAIKKLRLFQMSNGGFSYWPGSENTNLWGTNYAGHFIIEAGKNGYDIPNIMKENWLKYQNKKASNWTDDGRTSQLIQSYRLYTLALAGRADMSAMNRLRQDNDLYEKAAWRLAAAYQLTGKSQIASLLINKLPLRVSNYRYGATFGSSVRDEAMILETLVMMDEEKKAFDVLKEISNEIGSDRWYSTQTTAYTLLAASKYLDKYQVADDIKADVNLNSNSKSYKSNEAVLRIPLNELSNKENKLAVKNNSKGIIYARLIREGVPEPGTENASQNKIGISVNFKYPDGTSLDPASIKQGTDFICEVSVYHNSSYGASFDNIALTQIFPSGWEIINSRLFSTELGKNSYSKYQDIRDDRIYTYFDVYKNKTKTYKVMLNASFAGKYYLPAFSAEAMYDKTIHARNKGQWVNVVKQ